MEIKVLQGSGDKDSPTIAAEAEPGPIASQHVYRVSGTREELTREDAALRAAEALQRRPAGSKLVIERRPLHGRRWGEWRRYAVAADGWVSRVDR